MLKRVGTEQYVDMKNRYGQLKALPATMIVAKNQQGIIVGCAVSLCASAFLGVYPVRSLAPVPEPRVV